MFLGKLEADDAPLSLVYHYFGKLFNHYENNKTIQDKVKQRLRFLYTESMGLAYMLTPIHAAEGFYFGEDQTDIIGYATKLAQKVNAEDVEIVGEEMLSFVTKMSTLSAKQRDVIFKMSDKNYWSIIGRREFPALYKVAKPIIEMICSSATSERTWSTFKFVHSRLRNRLTNEKVEKLVFLYTNCVLLDENDKTDYILEDGAVLSELDYEDVVQ